MPLIIAVFSLLIEPFGIETVATHCTFDVDRLLLIEPFGIETGNNIFEHRALVYLLIEPFGIETC